MDENSHRDKVLQAVGKVLGNLDIPERAGDTNDITDAVFDALGITVDEQDKIGGYWMLHAAKDERKFLAPKKPLPEELDSGAKFTFEEFKDQAAGRIREHSGGWYVTLKTPIYRYEQAYDKGVSLTEAIESFAVNYYPMYEADYERSIAVGKMEKE